MKAILAEAVDWYVRLHDSNVSAESQARWQTWLDADPRHAQAWARLEQLQQSFTKMPSGLTSVDLQRARVQRRTAIKSLAMLMGVSLLGWQGYRASPWSVDYATQVGERRRLNLADGSRLELNTDSRVDIRFDAVQRLIYLRRGEILVTSGKDPRPLSVMTAEGHILALGTRFSVRQLEQLTQVTVEADMVEVHPRTANAQVMRVQAQQSLNFTDSQLGTLQKRSPGSSAWTQGMLIVVDWRLDRLLAELSRYRPGYLGCSKEVAAMRLSGAFKLDDDEAIFASLQDALPIRVRRLSRYWLRIESSTA